MSDRVMITLLALLLLGTGAVLLGLPFNSATGLLFGVYVGEGVSSSNEARSLRLRWKRWMLATVALSGGILVVAVALASWALVAAAALVLVVGYLAAYAENHRTARAWASSAPPEAIPEPGSGTAAPAPLPYLALTIGLAAGLIAIGYTLVHLDQLPARLPLSYGVSGRPEAFGPRGFTTIWVLPLVTFLLGALMGGYSVAAARTERTLRGGDGGRTPAAYPRFPIGGANVAAVLTIVMAGAMAQISISAVNVGLGKQPRLSMWALPVMVIAAIAALFELARRLARDRAPRRGLAPTPITGGLADNRRWVFGIFYVNREDPAWLVEQRFGYGYTVNLGNPRAAALVAIGGLLIVGLMIAILLRA
jgi:uncharacterized membrane protein